NLEPRQLLAGEDVLGRPDRARVEQGCRVKVDLHGHALAFVAERGSAGLAKPAPDARRGRIVLRRSPGKTEMLTRHANPSRDRRGGRAPAAFAMAIDGPGWGPLECKGDRPTQASPFGAHAHLPSTPARRHAWASRAKTLRIAARELPGQWRVARGR